MCISLMFGRLGGVVGANVAALLLDNHCQSAFYLSESSLLGKLQWNLKLCFFGEFFETHLNYISFTVIGVLAFFIPNIHKKVSKSNEVQNCARLSTISYSRSMGSPWSCGYIQRMLFQTCPLSIFNFILKKFFIEFLLLINGYSLKKNAKSSDFF